jgi:hypothetical protein
LLQAPIQDSILKFRWIEFILAQTGFLDYKDLPGVYNEPLTEFYLQRLHSIHLASFVCFLGIFAGYWPSGVERAAFLVRRDESLGVPFGRLYVQLHFRCFRLTDTLANTVGSDGLQCYRERGEIEPSDLGIARVSFEERRISIFGILSRFRSLGDDKNLYVTHLFTEF